MSSGNGISSEVIIGITIGITGLLIAVVTLWIAYLTFKASHKPREAEQELPYYHSRQSSPEPAHLPLQRPPEVYELPATPQPVHHR
ncbi:hypothetical protein BJ166DRAFT_509797, partial [Pestalotiopsis sp. NC0098]